MRSVIKYLKPYRAKIFAAIFTVLLSSMATLLLPTLLSGIIQYGVEGGDKAYITSTCFKMLGVAVLSLCFGITTGYLSSTLSAGFGRDLRQAVFIKIQSFSLAEFDKFEASSLITRTTNDVTQLQNATNTLLRIIISSPIMIISGVVMTYLKSPKLSVVVFFVLPIMFIIIWAISRRIVPITRIMQSKIDNVNLVMREKLTGVRVIRAFNNEDESEKRFDDANKDLANTAFRMTRMFSILLPSLFFLLNFARVSVVALGATEVANMNSVVVVADIVAVAQYMTQMLMSVTMLSMVFFMLPRAVASAQRIGEVLETVPAITPNKDGVTESLVPGQVEFKNVTFYYPGSEEPALKNISFVTQPGKVTAIIGSTGSGKSSIANLILRYYDVTEGSVLVGGVDVRSFNEHALKEKIGYAPQKALLFSGVINENIAYGQQLSDEKITQAAEIAQASSFIESKPGAYEAYVARGGNNFSGGQKQRLSIARAVAREPEIYIFDDSFSALDFNTESRLRAALSARTKNSTVLIVAQRVFSIMHADQIIVLDSGEIVGIGTHDELLKTSEVYKEIVYSQMSGEEV